MPVDVGANQSERFTAYARPGSRDPDLTIRLYDRKRPAGRERLAGHGDARCPPVAIMPDETVILTMGQPQGVETIVELPGFQGVRSGGTASDRRPGEEIVTARIDAQGGMMPGRWYGYDAAASSWLIPATARRSRRAR